MKAFQTRSLIWYIEWGKAQKNKQVRILVQSDSGTTRAAHWTFGTGQIERVRDEVGESFVYKIYPK